MGSPWTAGPGRTHKTANLFVVAATGALFLVSCLMLADWMKDRDDAYARPLPSAQAPMATVAVDDARIAPFLGGELAWNPARKDDFGRSPAYLATAHSSDGPEKVFARLIGPEPDEAAKRAAFATGPSAAQALRSQVTFGRMAGGAFLLRLPLDVTALQDDKLRTEPGAITLAFRAPAGWRYVQWVFPEGLGLDDLPAQWKASPRDLAPLEVNPAQHLEPVFAMGGSAGTPRTVICRAKGPAGETVENFAKLLEAKGWTRSYESERGDGTVRVLAAGGLQVWLAAPDARDGQMVSVVIGAAL